MDIKALNRLATDQIMSYAELKEDNVFSKIPKKDMKKYIIDPMNVGKIAAKEIKSKYPDNSLIDICKEKDITVNIVDKAPKVKLVKIRAEYIHHEKTLNIYRNSIDEMCEQFEGVKMGLSITQDKIIDIHIAHELFHFLENEELGLTNLKMKKVNLFRLFGKKRESTILKTREIAAHMFCKEIVGLQVHPKWLDYVYLLASSQITYERLNGFLKELHKEISDYL